MDSQITSKTANKASKKWLKSMKAIDTAIRLQKVCNGLQKNGKEECHIPIQFRFVTPYAADLPLIIAYVNIYKNTNEAAKLYLRL